MAIDGKAGAQELLRRCFRWRVGIQWYLIALFGMFVAVIIAALPLAGVAPLHMIVQKWQILFRVFLPGALIPFLHTNLPEEIGWTGFVQSRLQERYGSVKASLLVSLPFALIHLPSFFVAGWISDERLSLPEALVMVGVMAVFASFFRLLIMWLYNGTHGRTLPQHLQYAHRTTDHIRIYSRCRCRLAQLAGLGRDGSPCSPYRRRYQGTSRTLWQGDIS